MCEAGIDIEKAIDYLESRFLPTGYDKEKLRYEVNRSYGKNAEMFGMKRGEYKPYSEYKKLKIQFQLNEKGQLYQINDWVGLFFFSVIMTG